MALICHCEGVRERTVAKAVVHGAHTLADVQAACRAGAGCGGCHDAIADILRRQGRPASAPAHRRLALHAG